MAFIIVFSSNEDEKYQQLWYPFVIFQGLQVSAVLPDFEAIKVGSFEAKKGGSSSITIR